MESATGREMPKYQSHKQVWAMKIKALEPLPDGGLRITPEEEGYGTFDVDQTVVPPPRPRAALVGWY